MEKALNNKINNRKNYFGIALLALIAVVAVGCGMLGVSALNNSTQAVNVDSMGLALKGYDAVAYFKENLPREGNAEFTANYNGAKWQFISAENRDAFTKEPEKYAPQYGGYCAWAVGHNYTAQGDPLAWKIVDNKLYLNYNKDVQAKWQQEIPKYVAEGDKNWQTLAVKAEESRKDK